MTCINQCDILHAFISSRFTFHTFRNQSTHLFSSFKILRNFSALVWLLLAFSCSLASASSRRRIDFFKAAEKGKGKAGQRQPNAHRGNIFIYIHTVTPDMQRRPRNNIQPFIQIREEEYEEVKARGESERWTEGQKAITKTQGKCTDRESTTGGWRDV